WADLWAAKAERRLSAPHALYAAAWGLTPDVVGALSPLHAAPGLPLVEAALARAQGEPEREAAAIERFLHAVEPGLAAATSPPAPPPPPPRPAPPPPPPAAPPATARPPPPAPEPVRAALASRGAELASFLTQDLSAHPPIGRDPLLPSLGMAHGW